MIRLCALLLLLILLAHQLVAQDYYTVFNSSFDYSPGNSYDYDKENKVNIADSRFVLSVPILRENGDAWVTGFEFDKTRMYPKFNNPDTVSDSIYTGSYQFYRYRMVLGYNKKWSDDFSGAFTIIPSLSSDMEDVSAEDFQIGAAFLFTKIKKPDKFKWKYGLYVNTENFGLFVVPLIGWDWQMGQKWRMFGVLPRIMTIQYKASDRFRSGIKFEAPGMTFKLKDDVFTNYAGDPVGTYVQYLKNSLYVYGEVYLTKSIVLQARVGHSVLRFVRLYDEETTTVVNIWGINVGRKRPRIEASGFRGFSDGILLNASINYRFNLE